MLEPTGGRDSRRLTMRKMAATNRNACSLFG